MLRIVGVMRNLLFKNQPVDLRSDQLVFPVFIFSVLWSITTNFQSINYHAICELISDNRKLFFQRLFKFTADWKNIF